MTRLPDSLVFNELSAYEHTPAPDRYTSLNWMLGIVELLRVAEKIGIRSFRVSPDFMNSTLHIGFTPRHWMKDLSYDIPQDAQDWLTDYITNQSMIDYEEMPPDHPVRYRLTQPFFAEYDGREAIGLGYAHRLGMVAVSFASAEHWLMTKLKLDCLEMLENECHYREESVRHASNATHLFEHYPRRFYDPNPKHPIDADEKAYIAKMDLGIDQARVALFEGVQPDGMDEIYSYYGDNYYVFRPHDIANGKYHGYCVTEFNSATKSRILRAMREQNIIDEREYQRKIN